MSIYIRHCLQWCVCKVGTSFSHKDDSCTLNIHDAFFSFFTIIYALRTVRSMHPGRVFRYYIFTAKFQAVTCSPSQFLLEARLSNSSNPCLTSTSIGVSTHHPVLHFVKRWNYDFEIDTEDPTGSDFFKSGSLQWKTLFTRLQFRSGYPIQAAIVGHDSDVADHSRLIYKRAWWDNSGMAREIYFCEYAAETRLDTVTVPLIFARGL